MERRDDHWRSMVERLAVRGTPQDFEDFLEEWQDLTGADAAAAAAIYPMVIAAETGKTMLAASLELQPDEAERALLTIVERVGEALDQDAGEHPLDYRERDLYERALRVIEEVALPGGVALAATFRAYIRGADADEEDPNLLVRQAALLLAEEPEEIDSRGRAASAPRAAPALVGQAGALALRGRPLWQRWPDETDSPLCEWMMVVNGVLDHFEHCPGVLPLGPLEEARPRWPLLFEALHSELSQAESEASRLFDLDDLEGLIDDLDPFLMGDEEPTWEALVRLPEPHEHYLALIASNLENWQAWELDDAEMRSVFGNLIALGGEWRCQECVWPLIEITAGTAGTELDELSQAAAAALARLGEPARDEVFAFLNYSFNAPARAELALAVAEIAPQDAETFPLLQRLLREIDWHEGKELVVEALTAQGDARALGLLREVLARGLLEAWQVDVLRGALEVLEDDEESP